MAYDRGQHGIAEYNSWAHITSGTVVLEEPNEGIPLDQRKYAQLVYTVNPATTVISGDVNISTTFDDTMTISGDVGTRPLASKVETIGSNIYVGEANPGTAEATAAWRCKKITEVGSLVTTTWADGNAFFDNVATELSALSYS